MQRTISVSGEGQATAAPDIATINLGVTAHAATASAALAENNRAMSDATGRLRAGGVDAADLQTSGLRVHPQLDHRANDGSPPRTVGYMVMNRLTVVIRALPTLGDLLDELVSDGGVTNIDGVSFGIADMAPLAAEARRAAMADARTRAELYAAEAGADVGQILTISEHAGTIAPPAPMAEMAAMRSRGGPVPIEGGEVGVTCRVNVVFELAD